MKVLILFNGLLDRNYRIIKIIKYVEGVHDLKVFSRDNTRSLIPKIGVPLKMFLKALKYKPDIVYCSNLPMLPIGVLAKIFCGSKIIYDSREYFIFSRGVQERWDRRVFYSLLEFSLMFFVDKVVTVNDFIARELMERYSLDSVEVLYNYPLRQTLPVKKSSGIVRLVYCGNLSGGRMILGLLDVLEALPDNFVLTIIGGGPLEGELKRQTACRGLDDRVSFTGRVHPLHTHSILARQDIGLCFIENVCRSYYLSSPSKLFEYIGAGLPVVCTNIPFMDGFVKDYGVGLTVNNDSIEDVAGAVLQVAREYNGFKGMVDCVRERFSWEVQEDLLYVLFNSI